MPGSFFEQDHLLSLIILGVHAKRSPKCAPISKQKLMKPKIQSIVFFLTLRVPGNFLKKTEALDAELSKREEAVTISYSAAVDFLQYIYSVLVAKNMIRSRCSSGIFLHIYFLTILIMVTEWLYWKKVLFGCFRLMWLWILIAVMKRCIKRCALQRYRISFKLVSAVF